MGTLSSTEAADIASQYIGVFLIVVYKATMGTQVTFTEDPTAKLYIGQNSDFGVDAVTSATASPQGTVTMEVTKVSDTEYKYKLIAKGSTGGVSGRVESTSTVKVVAGNVTMKTTWKAFSPDTGTIPLVSGTASTSPATQPSSAAMVFTNTITVSGIITVLEWTLDAANLATPKWSYTGGETVAGVVSSQASNTLVLQAPQLQDAVGAVQNALGIYALTDTFGANLQQVAVILRTADTTLYPGQYPQDIIAGVRNKLVVDPNTRTFLKVVNMRRVLKGCGDYDLERAASIRDTYNLQASVQVFYQNLNDYYAVRYGLSGLLFFEWEDKWLLRNYFPVFLEKLAASPFAEFVPLYQPGGVFYGYEDFFLTEGC